MEYTICIDFDGTCVKHKYPEIGNDIGAQPILKELVDKNYKLILYTMRSEKELDEAIKWFSDNEIELYGVQLNPTQHTWTKSNKAYANLYIDDAALGIPLKTDFPLERPYVDWVAVQELLVKRGLLTKQ